MNDDFDKFLASCQVERMEILHRQLEQVQEIRLLRNEAAMLMERIQRLLPSQVVDLLSKYDDIMNEINSLESVFLYKNGLNDGLTLGRLLFEGKKDVDINIKFL
ncbi:MAG: hypothetical protein GX660_04440 [Clostridiaceae bacterium]|nr:hypothetical protein [Clostridiaceae bacterium]